MPEKLTGLIAAPYTPMHADGSINLAIIDQMASLFRKEGVAGAFVCGTTGEGASLTTQERMQIAEKWAGASGSDLKLIVHVGHNSLREAQSLAAHAQSLNAHGIAALAPSFFKPASINDLVAFCAPIAASAPDLPFYYYHIPSMTGVNLSMPAFLEAAMGKIPNLAGIKYSTSDLMPFHQCANMDAGRYTMFFGSDEMLLGALAMGAEAAVGSTYNYAAHNYLPMITAYRKGDLQTAQTYAGHAVELVKTLLKFGVLQAGKAIMSMRGIDCGPVRLPLRPMPAATKRLLFEEVSRLAIFEGIHLTPPAE